MGEDKALVLKQDPLTKKVNKLFSTKTPTKFIKSRPGAGGRPVKYVEIGYVINELNKAFGPFWEFQVTDKQIGKKQLWVQGRLTVKDPKTGFSVTKETFGGSDVKIAIKTGEPIDIANDLKAAVSDCTKKCASMFGIASDVFFKEQDQYDQMDSEVDVEAGEAESIHKIVMNKLFAIASEHGFSPEDLKEKLKPHFNVESMNDLTTEQMEKAINTIESNYQVVEQGEKPLKVAAVMVPEVTEVEDPRIKNERMQEFMETGKMP